MDPVALAILVTFVVLWAARGVGLLREWLEIRRARSNPIVRFVSTMTEEEARLIDHFVALGRNDAADEAAASRWLN